MQKTKITIIAVAIAVLLTFTACTIQPEGDRTVIKEPDKTITVIDNEDIKTDPFPVSVEKIDKYEGWEISDWFDEETVVLAKENPELGKMSLLENSEFYPRSIYLYNLVTKEFKTVKAQKDFNLGGATLSPDRRHLLFYEYSIGDPAYYLMSMEEDEQTPVTENVLGTALSAGWTNDNNVIGISYAGGIYMADTSRNITRIDEMEEHLFRVQKTQDKIYYVTLDAFLQLHVMDLITKEKKNLNLENADGIIPSPDGKQILITQGTETTRKLLVADAEGNILRTIAEGAEVTGASWSPDQMMIAYPLKTAAGGADNSGLYLYDVLTGKSVQIAVNIEVSNISWSPSGKKIAVTEMDGTTYNSSIISLK